MRAIITAVALIQVILLILCTAPPAPAGQVWTKCHVTCRCLQNNSVGNFTFVLPIDESPDTSHDANLLCRQTGYAVCRDGCNTSKFSYTYQVTSP
ncbi:MAG: hypothetical protein V2B18_10420 [Pseudomonadota bacterium]